MEDHATKDSAVISAVRGFSRFYTRRLRLLDKTLLETEFSLTEARILYELAHHDALTATDLCGELDLDAGYVSRIVSKFERRGFVSRTPSSHDARRSLLHLTEAGRAAFEPMNRASREQVAALLAPLTDAQVNALTESMRTIERLLSEPAPTAVPYMLRPHQIGDIGWIVRRHGQLYAQEYGWSGEFEAFVAEIGAHFIRTFDPQWERCWIAECAGAIVGSVFLVRESDTVAKLRMLYVEPEARGLGIGRRMVEECILFARQKGYHTITLWTNDVLVSARRIYEATGFRLVKEEPHHSFGKDLVGQSWELTL